MCTSDTNHAEPVKCPEHFRAPSCHTIEGSFVDLEPLNESNALKLYPHVCGSENVALWNYLPAGPFDDKEEFVSYIVSCARANDSCFWAIVDKKSRQYLGHISFLRINTTNLTVEIGNILYARSLQKTSAASEAWYLLAKEAFECGFRRLEWKCDARNEPSRRSAARFGHVFEGVFRQHMVVKGRNRDTAWFSILDKEWPLIQTAYKYWVSADNTDTEGKQRDSLTSIRNKLLDAQSV